MTLVDQLVVETTNDRLARFSLILLWTSFRAVKLTFQLLLDVDTEVPWQQFPVQNWDVCMSNTSISEGVSVWSIVTKAFLRWTIFYRFVPFCAVSPISAIVDGCPLQPRIPLVWPCHWPQHSCSYICFYIHRHYSSFPQSLLIIVPISVSLSTETPIDIILVGPGLVPLAAARMPSIWRALFLKCALQ